MEPKNTKLIEKARSLIRSRKKDFFHQIGAALRTRSGKEFAAVHLEANVGRVAVCAEAIAIGMAASEGDTEIEVIVAVNTEGNVVSPCGMCRELISDYSPSAQVIIPGAVGECIVSIDELLPNKYRAQQRHQLGQ